ncbi:MAG TPA: hypothetical protein VGF60_11225, partial [Xanthobacteraceae bacterium]
MVSLDLAGANGGYAMSHRLTHVVIVATLATTAVWDRPAFADDWSGSATCTVNPTDKNHNYQNTETHTWTIDVPQMVTPFGAGKLYAEKWAVTGGGDNAANSWTTNGGASGGQLWFWISTDGRINIKTSTGLHTDPQGILVTPKSGGSSFHGTVQEIDFPTIPSADPMSTCIEGNSNPPPTMGSGGFFLAPSTSTTTTTCRWKFQYGPACPIRSPGDVVIGPPEDSKPLPGGIKPLVPATLSIFFGGPGGGSVAAPEFSCLSDCTPPGVSEGQIITLTPTPDATSVFAGWGGASCSGTSSTCSVTIGASNRVIAYFRSKFKTVAAGAYHTCALRPLAGDVVCWGYNVEGQTGTGITTSLPLAPSPVTGITNAVAVAAGGHHTCALLADGTVSCWGKNDNGQTGDAISFPTSNATPMTVPGISEAVAVTAGGAHTCVVHAGGSASCWGLNKDGQLGAGSTPSDHTPTPVSVALGAVGPLTKQIAAGAYHTCAIVADSTVTCWGLNSDGQAGARVLISDPGGPALGCIIPPGGVDCVSAAEGSADTVPVIYLKVTTIAASIGVGQLLGGPPLGGYHTVALDSSGMDWGWGNNNNGQLPDGAGGGVA